MTQKSSNYYVDLLAEETNNELAVASTGTVYGKSFALERGVSYGLEVRFSGTAIDVKIDLEEGTLRPATEGSVDAEWGVGDDVSSGVTDGNTKLLAVTPVVAQYGRLKFTGQGSNAANAKCIKARLHISKN